MARTYRLRHLPVLPGTARKITNGIGITRGDKTEAEIWKEVARTLGAPYRGVAHNWRARWRLGISKEEWDLFYRLEKDAIFPIGGFWKHPWVRRCAGARVKTWYKIAANRMMRHKEKETLNKLQPDFDVVLLPTTRWFFDPWTFD